MIQTRFSLPALALCASLLATSAVYAAPAAAPSKALAAVIADYDRYEVEANPLGAGSDGVREALSRLPDDSPQAQARRVVVLKGLKARLAAIPAARLNPEDALNRAYLTRVIDETLEYFALDGDRLNFDSYGGFHLLPSEMATTTNIRDRADADAWLARLAAIPRYFDTEIANARRGITTGFTQPKSTLDVVLTVVHKQVDQKVEDSLLLKPFEALPATIPATDQATLRARLLTLVREGVKPAQQKVLTFLEGEYLPHVRKSLAARDLPNGEVYYRFVVRSHTTTDLTPDQIHAIGEREVARIRAEMEQTIKASGFTGDFKAFQTFLRTDPQFYVKTREELLQRSALFNKTVDDKLPHFFGRLPRLPFAVREIPAESAEGATTAYYEGGAPKLGQAGGYMVNTTHLDQRPLYEIPSLSLHESEPGHHLQIALQQERDDIPAFRRRGGVTAYVEGWALYTEHLGIEMGMYKTPYENFGRLSYEMWRACRLVADTGIHWLRWNRDEARACFTDNTALSAKNIEVELDRYIAWPGQALGYKIGELKIRELRARAEKELGPKFDIRAFHDAVLLDGPVPLSLLEQRIDGWIGAQKAKG